MRLQLYRENIFGALEIVEAAHAKQPDARYAAQAAQIRSWLGHLESRDAYIRAQEHQYRSLRWRAGLKLLEKRIRIAIGRKTKKLVRRRAAAPEFVLLGEQIAAARAARVLDAGSGEGGVAIAVAARHPAIEVDAVDVSATNVKLARKLGRRYANVRFHEGLAEEVHERFPAASFDLAFSFAVLEHVVDVDRTVASILTVLRPGGRFCFVVPMHEFAGRAPLPEYRPIHGFADHCRVFTEAELRERFGRYGAFTLVKMPGRWKLGEFPDAIDPVEFGAFFVAFSKP